MFFFALRRLALSAFTLIGVALLVFVFTQAVGDPVTILLPPTRTERDINILREELGLDKPLPVQFGVFLSRAARGDFGRSYFRGRTVSSLIAERVPATLEIAALSLFISVALGLPLGIVAGVWPRSLAARGAMWVSMLGVSLPTFWLGLLLMMFFGVKLHWLPAQGRGPTTDILGMKFSFTSWAGFRCMILPSVTLALHNVALLTRLVRSELFDTLKMPFIRVARAYGTPEAAIVGKHAMRNTLIPIITIVGVEFGQLIAFSVVTETIFEWPGLGKLLMESIKQLDRPVIVTYILLTGALFLAINAAIDVAYVLIDPRIRVSSGGASN